MEKTDNVIRFDWAAKNILRNKAEFTILEGLVSAIINEKITIVELLESESNREHKEDKANRVDIKAKDSLGQIIIIEIQQADDLNFLHRILYSTAKTITEHISIGQDYTNVKKVFSINILYFNLGIGDDYLYHGQSELTGVNTGDRLIMGNDSLPQGMRLEAMNNVFPEYYVLRVNQFDATKEPTTAREEWMRYLKTGYIDPNTNVPGLREAWERLKIAKMTVAELKQYKDYQFNRRFEENVINAARFVAEKKGMAEGREQGLKEGRKKGLAEGREKGLEEGREKGLEEGRKKGLEEGRKKGLEEGKAEGKKESEKEIALKMKAAGMSPAIIAELTGVTNLD